MSGASNSLPASDAPGRSAFALANARRWARFLEGWRVFRRDRAGMVGLVLLIVIVLLALLAPVISSPAALDPTQATAPANQAPTLANPLGTDPLGRSVLQLLLWGSRVSLLVGVTATVISLVIGTVVGLLAGHFRGVTSQILMRVIDFFLVIPGLVLAIVIASVLNRGTLTVIIAIGVTGWAGTARLIRAQTLTLETRGYVERAVALGAGDWHVMFKHVLPGVLPLVLTNATLAVGGAVIAEAALSFLGIASSSSSWGAMLELAFSSGAATAGYWWYILPPGIAIVIVVLCFTLVGRALEAVVNPTLLRRR